jgi:hypothetical protein
MKGRFFSKKEWRERKIAEAKTHQEAYEQGRKDAQRALAPDILAAAVWVALQQPRPDDLLYHTTEVHVPNTLTKQVGYVIKDGNYVDTQRVELYLKSLLP